jgi:hypothetical protein
VTRVAARSWRRAAGLVIGLALLAVVASRADLAATVAALSRLDARRLALPALVTVAATLLRAWRWQTMLPPATRPGVGACFRALALGNLANNVLFARAGDVLRCGLLQREHRGVGLSAALGAVGLEKVLDGLVLVAVVGAACAVLSPPEWLSALLAASAALFGGGLAVLGVLQRRGDRVLGALRAIAGGARVGRTVVRAERLVVGVTGGLGAIGSPARLGQVAGQTLAVWAADACVVWTLARALGTPLASGAAAAVSAVVGLGLAVPAAPGAVGTYEFFAVAGLRLFDVAPAEALALALLMHAWAVGSTTVLGLAVLADRSVRSPGILGLARREGAAR